MMRCLKVISIVMVVTCFIKVDPLTLGTKGLYCLVCNHVPSATDCDTIVNCGPHGVCYSTEMLSQTGHIYRKMGCRDTLQCGNGGVHAVGRRAGDVAICDECCNSTFCQANLCQDRGYIADRGPLCFNCDHLLPGEDCTRIIQCSKDEVCTESLSRSPSNHILRNFACLSKNVCERVYGSNSFHRTSETCFNCCKDDLCNTSCDMKQTSTKPLVAVVTQPGQSATTGECKDSTPEATCKLAAIIVCQDQFRAQNANCKHYCGFC